MLFHLVLSTQASSYRQQHLSLLPYYIVHSPLIKNISPTSSSPSGNYLLFTPLLAHRHAPSQSQTSFYFPQIRPLMAYLLVSQSPSLQPTVCFTYVLSGRYLSYDFISLLCSTPCFFYSHFFTSPHGTYLTGTLFHCLNFPTPPHSASPPLNYDHLSTLQVCPFLYLKRNCNEADVLTSKLFCNALHFCICQTR